MNFDETNPITVYDMPTDKYGQPLKVSTYSLHNNFGSYYNLQNEIDINT